MGVFYRDCLEQVTGRLGIQVHCIPFFDLIKRSGDGFGIGSELNADNGEGSGVRDNGWVSFFASKLAGAEDRAKSFRGIRSEKSSYINAGVLDAPHLMYCTLRCSSSPDCFRSTSHSTICFGSRISQCMHVAG